MYYKFSKDEKVTHHYLEKSQGICNDFNLIGQQVENFYDEGNYYLYIPEKKNKINECWGNGYKLYTDNKYKLEHLTLNSLKKKIQLDLINHNYQNIEMNINKSLDYIETGKYNQQSLFFLASIYFLKSIYGLSTNNLTHIEIEKSLDLAAKYYVLKNNEKPYAIHFLYAKLNFLKKEYDTMLYHYDTAIKLLKEDFIHFKYIKKIITDDCLYKIALIKKSNLTFCISNDKNYSEVLQDQINTIFQMTYLDVNNLIKNFSSIANLTDKEKKDGFLL